MPKKLIYKERRVKSWEEAKRILGEFPMGWIFRGQSDSAWGLATTLERRLRNPLGAQWMASTWVAAEQALLREFKRGAHLFLDESALPTNLLEWLTLMQHYGVPTRLLDFSSSPYVASFFALENNERATDRVVWALDRMAFVSRVTEYIKKEPVEDVFQRLRGVDLYFGDMWRSDSFLKQFLKGSEEVEYNVIVPVGSPWVSERIMVQQSEFVMPSRLDRSFMESLEAFKGKAQLEDLIKIVIPVEYRMEGLSDLHRMNITRASLFPGLDGFAQSIATTLELAGVGVSRRIDALSELMRRATKKSKSVGEEGGPMAGR